ncbi:hypothetical protein C2I36_01605 [Rhodobacteraceae bacterium WD3A24]|nr:hypothetical protein C2I36_01605 [Rhodobacteraceae bacterium WD3A24]
MHRILKGLVATAAVSLSAATGAAQTAERATVMVFDASGSMWAQIEDGKSRIEIARDVIDDYAANRDADAPIGVVAYGHHRRGDCGDIETVLPLGAHDAATLSSTIRAINPVGMTPLTDSLRRARQMIPRTAESADIILVTDGLENCGGDPCALAREIAGEGIDIRAHVVGFGMEAEAVQTMSCLPEQTGGQLFTANTGAELAEALTVVSAPQPQAVELRAVDAADGAMLDSATWNVAGPGGEAILREETRTGAVTLDLMPGGYIADATAPGYAGTARFEVTPEMAGPVEVMMQRQFARVLVSAENAATGEALSGVEWTVIDPAAETAETHVAEGAGAYELRVEPGDYRIEGRSGDMTGGLSVTAELGRETRVTVPLSAPLPEATLDAPAEAPAGATIQVGWDGPDDDRDYITWVEPGAPEGSYNAYTRTSRGSPVSIQLPDALGQHELRYVHQETGRTLASRTITLTPVEATLDAPQQAVAGSTIEVAWSGPDNDRDYITVVEAGAPEGEYLDYTRTSRGSLVSIQLPDALGAHELRYVIQQSGRTLASREIELVPATGSVSAPEEIPAGSTFEVAWDGPDNDRDYITIVEAGAPEGEYLDYTRTSRGNPVTLQAPDALGAYEVRYVIQQSGRTLASQEVTLTPVSASVSGPDEAVAGSTIEVEWDGPDNPRDYITVVEAGAPEGEYLDYTRTSRGSPVSIQLPDALGAHELRYVVQQSGRTLARQPITLVPAAGSVHAPEEIPAGSTFEVAWEGPDNDRDYITIVEAGAPEGASLDYTRTSRGNPLTLQAPDGLGTYEVRYVIQQSGRTLASQEVTLTPVSAQLMVNGPVVPGGTFDVQWTGPDNPRDYITIVEAGASEGSYTDYVRTSRGSPVTLDAPDQEGDYEVRYVIQQSGRTLASLPVTVGAGEVSLSVEGAVSPGGVVNVVWQGPGRYEDFIEIVSEGAPDDAEALRDARASQGSPLQLFAPSGAGTYELRYRASDSGEVLARIPLEVGG